MKKESRFKFDGELFYKLVSVQNALVNSVHEPICIGSGIPSYEGKRHAFSIMYYDAEDGGEEIIKNRVISFPEDIKTAVNYHEDFLLKFYSVKAGVIDNDRSRIHGEVKGLCAKLSGYLNFVKAHQGNAGKNSFLYFPTCMPGHFILLGRQAMPLNFNYEQTEYSARKEIKNLLEINELFSRITGDVIVEDFGPPLLNLLGSKEYKESIDLVKKLLKGEFDFFV